MNFNNNMDIIDKLNENNQQSLESIRLKNQLEKHEKEMNRKPLSAIKYHLAMDKRRELKSQINK